MPRPILYYITDRHAFPGDADAKRRQLLGKVEDACRAGVDYIQLREKDLPGRDLEALCRDVLNIVQPTNLTTEKRRTALLINSRADIALAVGADGVHLPANGLAPEDIRGIWKFRHAGSLSRVTISVACHTV